MRPLRHRVSIESDQYSVSNHLLKYNESSRDHYLGNNRNCSTFDVFQRENSLQPESVEERKEAAAVLVAVAVVATVWVEVAMVEAVMAEVVWVMWEVESPCFV